MRQIIQIASIPEGSLSNAMFMALCNDGTVWTRPASHYESWTQLEPIPQPEPGA